MSLLEKYDAYSNEEAVNIIFEHFNQSSTPYDDLTETLLQLTQLNDDKNASLINCFVHSFVQWKAQCNKTLSIPTIDQNVIDELLSQSLPIECLKNFIEIFQIDKPYLLDLLRKLLNSPMNSNSYKRGLNIIVKLDYQLDFNPNEILLPLILNSKDHFIDIYLNNKPQYEEYLIDLLNHLYENGGKKIEDKLKTEYNMKTVSFNKKTLSRLSVRYWNSYGHEQNDKYPNLATLQNKRTLGYLVNVKYNGINDEKTMSDECWNELVAVNRKEKI